MPFQPFIVFTMETGSSGFFSSGKKANAPVMVQITPAQGTMRLLNAVAIDQSGFQKYTPKRVYSVHMVMENEGTCL